MYHVVYWLNYQEKGDPIPAHYHWNGLFNLDETYYATYYINAEPSITNFKFPNDEVITKDNQLKSTGSLVNYQNLPVVFYKLKQHYHYSVHPLEKGL